MAAIDTAAWTGPLSEAEPCGPNLEFDGDFGALDRASQGKPEQQFGTTIIPAEEPDWKEMETLARGLMERTRDLRVLGQLTVARLRLGGLPDYAALLDLSRGWLSDLWETVHPQLDPEDDNDPALRANALLLVASPAWVLRYLRDLPLVRAPRVGQFSWRQMSMATGQLPPLANEEPPSETTIRGAFAEADPAAVAATTAAVKAARAALRGISDAFDDKAGAGTGPNFEDLEKLLHEMDRFLDRFAVHEAAAEEPAAETAEDAAAPMGVAPAAPRAGGASAASLTAVNTRADALRLLDLVCQYYERAEPSSPLPLLIRRAQRLADKSFIEILSDLAPDGVMQARMMTGVQD
ncbi:MAG: type VI secretion system protein TssA [Acetobacteraceae bacterium]